MAHTNIEKIMCVGVGGSKRIWPKKKRKEKNDTNHFYQRTTYIVADTIDNKKDRNNC